MTIKSNAGTVELEIDLYCSKCGRPLTATFEEPYVEYYSRLISRLHVDPCAQCLEDPNTKYCGRMQDGTREDRRFCEAASGL